MSEIVSKINAEAQFQFNRGTAEEWAQNDMVLAEGEPALLLDENKKTIGIKYGDGKKKFSELELFKNGSGGDFANIIKQKVSGNPIIAHDVSPIEHELEITVKSDVKNLLAYPFPQSTKTVNGVTITDNGDGSLTLKGKATETGYYVFNLGTSYLTTGVYTISLYSQQETQDVSLNGTYDGNSSNNITVTVNTPITVSILKQIGLYLNFVKGATFDNLIVKPQIEIGSVATDWVSPYIDLSTVSVCKCGKNLFTPQMLKNSNGNGGKDMFTFDEASGYYVRTYQGADGCSFITNQHLYYDENKKLNNLIKIPKGNAATLTIYDFHWDNTVDSSKAGVIVALYNADGTKYIRTNMPTQSPTVPTNISYTFAANTEDKWLDFGTNQKNYMNKYFSKIQVELNDTATDYEPYVEPVTVNAKADGTVKGLTSISPNITLVADNPNVIIDCEYNTDTKTYIDNKFAELSAAILNS